MAPLFHLVSLWFEELSNNPVNFGKLQRMKSLEELQPVPMNGSEDSYDFLRKILGQGFMQSKFDPIEQAIGLSPKYGFVKIDACCGAEMGPIDLECPLPSKGSFRPYFVFSTGFRPGFLIFYW